MSTALEDLGMIGDGETVALVSNHGAIEWLCLPCFDSPVCCAALLGTSEQGRWSIAPDAPIAHVEQHYQGDTLILETDRTSAAGVIRLTDFMPMREGPSPVLVRIVTGLSGTVPTLLDAAFRFDYGQLAPWVTPIAGGVVMQVGPSTFVLHGDRMAGTIALIEETLVHDGLVERHATTELTAEGVFLACSFWLAECQLLQGRRADAVATIERVMAIRWRWTNSTGVPVRPAPESICQLLRPLPCDPGLEP